MDCSTRLARPEESDKQGIPILTVEYSKTTGGKEIEHRSLYQSQQFIPET